MKNEEETLFSKKKNKSRNKHVKYGNLKKG